VEHRSDSTSIASHPAAKIFAREEEHARIAAEFMGNHPILGRIDAINDQVRSLLHGSNIPGSWSSRY
jgi:hypothetical protein